jgi:hypothetical protein
MSSSLPTAPPISPSSSSSSTTKEPPKKWLMDRVQGQSKYNNNERPPNPCCWVSPFVGYFPKLFETNLCCRSFGSIGCFSGNELFRFYILHFGFLCNVIALLMTSYAALSISLEYFLLSKSAFQEINITETVFNDGAAFSTTTNTVYLGLSGIGIEKQQIVIVYNDLCAYTSLAILNLTADNGNGCNWIGCFKYFSMNCIISILLSIATFFPTFFMTQLRMYSGYDINCVKNTLSLVGIITVLLNLNVILSYFFLCARSAFYQDDETVYFDGEGDNPSFVQPTDVSYYIETNYEWKWSWGLIMLVAGTGLKLIDVLCNIFVSTPTITRDIKEQEVYENI